MANCRTTGGSGRLRWSLSLLLFLSPVALEPSRALAQTEYSVRFEMEKTQYLLGEPIFCRFVIRNTGSKAFAFRYRSPSRALSADYDQEPRFRISDSRGQILADPGPRPCGSPQGANVYGSVNLPPGEVHAERWLLNQWGRFSAPGRYHVRAERRLELLPPGFGDDDSKPLAFALAIDEFDLQVSKSTPAEMRLIFQPYVENVKDPGQRDVSQAVLVLTSLPQPFFLNQLRAMASTGNGSRWDRRDALNGLARLDTPAAWKTIAELFQAADATPESTREGAEHGDDAIRAYALLLLAEKGDPTFVAVLLKALPASAEPLRGDILRSLGFFRDPRAYQTLFDNLHSHQVTDRMNAILGLKNLGAKEAIPALIAALNDPEAQVRAVANFALEGLTGYKIAADGLSPDDPRPAVNQWHAWWQEHEASFSPRNPDPCHEW